MDCSGRRRGRPAPRDHITGSLCSVDDRPKRMAGTRLNRCRQCDDVLLLVLAEGTVSVTRPSVSVLSCRDSVPPPADGFEGALPPLISRPRRVPTARPEAIAATRQRTSAQGTYDQQRARGRDRSSGPNRRHRQWRHDDDQRSDQHHGREFIVAEILDETCGRSLGGLEACSTSWMMRARSCCRQRPFRRNLRTPSTLMDPTPMLAALLARDRLLGDGRLSRLEVPWTICPSTWHSVAGPHPKRSFTREVAGTLR